MQARDGEPCVSGVVLLNNFRAFEQTVGTDAYARAIRSLPRDVAEQYHSLVPVAWMPTRVADKSYSRGRMVAEFPKQDDAAEARMAVLTLSDWPEPPQYRLLAIAAGVRAVLRVTGRTPVSIDVARLPDGARFEVRWRR